MQISAQTGPHYGDLMGDPELAVLLGAQAEIRAMVEVEIALARAQTQLGILPDGTGAAMARALEGFIPDPNALRSGITSSGVPVPALVSEIRAALPDNLAQWVHWGATTQDIVDTATMMQAAQCLEVFQTRLARLIDMLSQQARAHAQTLMAGRTRTQMAAPITLGLRIAQWAQPLISLENELGALQQRCFRIQFGGAVGAQTAVAPHGPAISLIMATELGLADGPPWHVDRSGIIALAFWLVSLNTALTKFAKDLLILARSEVAEVFAGEPGSSSTMPQKANPVQSEMIVALGSIATALQSGLVAAASPVEERDGASWSVEWVLLPQLLLTCGAAMRHAVSLAETLRPDTERMSLNLTDNSGLMAEAASFALANVMPRTQAQGLVKVAAQMDMPLREALAEVTDAKIDWPTVLDPARVIAPCEQVIDAILSRRTR